MACWIEFASHRLLLNNSQFSSLIEFAVDVALQTSETAAEKMFANRMVLLNKEEFWPGRGIQIEKDFPEIAERKFWARVFPDTARAIFDRKVGNQEHSFWQAQCIHQAFEAGRIFHESVKCEEPGWLADTIDRREFDRVINKG